MKDAQQWHGEGVANIASGLHRVYVREIRAIQIDALREAREIALSAGARMDLEVEVKAGILDQLDALIRGLDLQ